MFTKRIIPCLDIQEGKVVKGKNFTNITPVGDAVEMAMKYELDGADEIAFLDITATYEKRPIFYELVEKVAESLSIPFSVGGGIASVDVIARLIALGVEKVSIGSAAITRPGLLRQAATRVGSQAIVLSLDVKRNHFMKNGWEIYIQGGRTPTGIDALNFAAKMEQNGAGEVLLNSIDQDGTREGFDLDLTRSFSENLGIPIIASGGAGSLESLYSVLTEGKADAALAASIFHYNTYSVNDVKRFLNGRGVEVRL